MKKTLITLAALAVASVAQAGSEYYTQDNFDNGVLTLTTALSYEMDWSLTFGAQALSSSSGNTWGTAVLASGSNPLADSYTGGFQLYQKAATTTTNPDEAIMIDGEPEAVTDIYTGDPLMDTEGKQLYYKEKPNTLLKLNSGSNSEINLGNRLTDGYIAFTLSYTAETRTLAFYCQQLGITTPKTSTISEGTAAISQLSTSLGSASGWSITNLTVTGTAIADAPVNAPEPATATLSLLALAGLAARRRRK